MFIWLVAEWAPAHDTVLFSSIHYSLCCWCNMQFAFKMSQTSLPSRKLQSFIQIFSIIVSDYGCNMMLQCCVGKEHWASCWDSRTLLLFVPLMTVGSGLLCKELCTTIGHQVPSVLSWDHLSRPQQSVASWYVSVEGMRNSRPRMCFDLPWLGPWKLGVPSKQDSMARSLGHTSVFWVLRP